jgi:uncharacterized GH25 family protein
MKRFLHSVLMIFATVVFFLPQTASSHDGWVEITPTIVEKGQPTTISLIQGNHSNEHRSYRIAGKWDQKYTTLVVIDHKGKNRDLTDRLVDFGEDDEKVGPKGPKGFYLASFTPNEEGLYQAVARQVRTVQHGDGPKVLMIRTAKTTFASLNIPAVSTAKNLKGFDLTSGGRNGLEIFPITNPIGIFSGSSVTLELRLSGKPVADKVISLIRKFGGSGSAQDRTTDEKGRVIFAVGPSDYYLSRVIVTEETPRPDGQVDKSSYEATYVFQVFNRP